MENNYKIMENKYNDDTFNIKKSKKEDLNNLEMKYNEIIENLNKKIDKKHNSNKKIIFLGMKC